MTWRLAKSLETYRNQINKLAPSRNKASDGTIGDAAHSSRTSDHNPNPAGVVCAIDITHDPQGGVDCNSLAESLVASRDPRIKYIIWNRRINSSITSPWNWRNYTGGNPHTMHLHLSVHGQYDDVKEWAINVTPQGDTEVAAPVVRRPLLRQGDRGDFVKELQTALKAGLVADGIFGPKTRTAVVDFQKANQLVPDGLVGPYTWEVLTS